MCMCVCVLWAVCHVSVLLGVVWASSTRVPIMSHLRAAQNPWPSSRRGMDGCPNSMFSIVPCLSLVTLPLDLEMGCDWLSE